MGSSHDNRVLHPLLQLSQQLVPIDIQPQESSHLRLSKAQQLGGTLKNINRNKRCVLRDEEAFNKRANILPSLSLLVAAANFRPFLQRQCYDALLPASRAR